MDVIRLSNMVFYAYHGVDDNERDAGQRFEVDVELATDLRLPGQTDRLRDTIDARQVYRVVEEVVIQGDFRLVEALAENIAAALLENFAVHGVVVRVRKPFAPIPGVCDGIEVEIAREA
ncbi:MAG: dihydroneopterin aldolase [Candidatus Oleimicrobiaceae bacterium]